MPAPPASACAQAAGRIAAFVAIPAFLWIQQGFGLNAVFVAIAVIVAIAAIAVTQVGPEAARPRPRRNRPADRLTCIGNSDALLRKLATS